MFKIYEKDKSITKLVDSSHPLADRIRPGTILYNGPNGLRVAGVGDSITADNAGLFFVSNDHSNNMAGCQLYGAEEYSTPHLAVLSVMERVNIDTDMYSFAHGDVITIEDGALTKAGYGTTGLLRLGVVSIRDDRGYPYGRNVIRISTFYSTDETPEVEPA